MPVLLSLAAARDRLYGAGPDGLFRFEGDDLAPVAEPQPMASLYCCATVGSLTGHVLLTGGAPHGTALRDAGAAGSWQAGWMDYTDAPVLALAPAPDAAQTGVVLAASGGAGILRSANRGRTWGLVNFGLHEFTVLALAWAPPPPPDRWPAREIVFAGSERGLYRSPAGGLGWQRVDGIDDAVQALAVSPNFHTDGLVLAGTENRGLWRSCDGGRTFAAVPRLPARIDALLACAAGCFAATPDGVYRSGDGQAWAQIAGSPAALCLIEHGGRVLAGGESGLHPLN